MKQMIGILCHFYWPLDDASMTNNNFAGWLIYFYNKKKHFSFQISVFFFLQIYQSEGTCRVDL